LENSKWGYGYARINYWSKYSKYFHALLKHMRRFYIHRGLPCMGSCMQKTGFADVVNCVLQSHNTLSWIFTFTLSMVSKDSTSRMINLNLGFLPFTLSMGSGNSTSRVIIFLVNVLSWIFALDSLSNGSLHKNLYTIQNSYQGGIVDVII